MKKPSFNQSQMGAACAVIHAYGVNHGGTGTDIHQRTASLAVLAILLGMVDAVPGPYKHLVGDVIVSADPEENETLTVTLAAPVFDINAEAVQSAIEDATAARVAELFDGTARAEDGSLNISQHFADALKVEPGKWVTFMTMAAAVGALLAKQSAPPIEPEPKADLEAMTVDELRTLAADNNVPLDGKGKKADIIATLREFNF